VCVSSSATRVYRAKFAKLKGYAGVFLPTPWGNCITVRELNRRRIDSMRLRGLSRDVSLATRQPMSAFAAAGDGGRHGPGAPSETVDVVVQVVLAPIHQATVESGDGRQFSITRKTPALQVDALVKGQRIRCTIAPDAPKVLHAQLL